MSYLKIGEVARETGIGIETIRFYERKGLLDEPDRRPSGYRQYDDSVIARLRFIRRSKELGFTLSEINELLGLWFDTETRCCDVRHKAQQKIGEIEEKVKTLNGMKRSLKKLIEQCQRRGSLKDCPLLDGLGDRARSGKA
ncbi:MAG: MerR family transcriptional regulator [Planctomycetota bacterium]|nr:MAG: MerR family transcriptional regulator [Planctomycetota bacterium]REJ94238.1 MAG: MerR family transcriptional regulator [Planctomycetota bacterium]REK20218.1 MAG: MerR family transcriptional regulator [Planctomycetota bacterium]REK35328.1 MAG: MerR family transcriptional regulator [Planctomycetota bacterium]